jgi:hypothetical protein
MTGGRRGDDDRHRQLATERDSRERAPRDVDQHARPKPQAAEGI